MDQKINLIGSFATDWIRYDDYTIKETPDKKTYIVPSENAGFSMYNPFDVSENLLIDLMQLGQKALKIETQTGKKDNETELKKEILIFAKKYGLLGFISSSVYNRNVIGDEHVLMVEGNPITKQNEMNAKAYIQLFIPFVEEGEVVFRTYKKSVDVQKREDSPKFYGKRPVVMDLVFSRFYSEQVQWIIDFSKMMVKHFNQLLMYRDASKYLTEDITVMAGQFHAEKIGFTINQLDKTTIAWQFDSLKTTIETIYAFAVTDENILLNCCNHCDKIYIAKSSREKYCSPSCRNCANVRKSRNRKRLQKEKENKNGS